MRFDDPTVSRRHALIVRHADGVRLLDDRSLNGVFVNGARVDGQALQDGDEIIVGRYRLLFVERAASRSSRARAGPDLDPEPRLERRRAPPSQAGPQPASRASRAPPRASTRSIASMAHTIAVLSQKGGTGKTTTVRTLADVLRRSGVRTLTVDLDPQGNLSDYFDLPPDVEPTIADVLVRARGGRRGDPRGHHPGEPDPGRGRADARRQDGPRADAPARAGGARGGLRRDPDRLPALARAADGQRARRRRPTR